jgi:hypothetical protein
MMLSVLRRVLADRLTSFIGRTPKISTSDPPRVFFLDFLLMGRFLFGVVMSSLPFLFDEGPSALPLPS